MAKKMMMVIILAILLTGCGQSAVRSEFWQHESVYKNWDHMKFSWFGYNNPPNPEDFQKSIDQQWWGIEVPYVPGQ